MHETVSIEKRAGLALVTLNRPAVGNAIDLQMARELDRCVRDLSTDSSVRVVLLSGAGGQFCVGGDLTCPAVADADIHAHVLELTSILHTAITGLVHMNAPVIAAVRGTVAGAGIGLIAAADLAVVAASTKFRLAYSAVGLTPDCGLSWLLPQIIGRKRAMDLLLTNRVLSAQEAAAWGFVNEVVADEMLHEAAEQLAGKLAAGPLQAFGATKRLVAAAQKELEAQMGMESRTIAAQRLHPEGREGVNAFFERRKPAFL